MSKFLTAPQWYDAGGGLNKSLDVNCNGSDTATAFGEGANATNKSVAIGHEANSTKIGGIAIGKDAKANDVGGIAIGEGAACVQTSKPSRRIQFFDRDIFPRIKTSEIGFGRDSLLDLIYPIGAIYIGMLSYNPGTIFGGTWEAFAKGRTLVGVDTASMEFEEAGGVGGSTTVTLTTDQMPAHTHYLSKEGAGSQQTMDPVFASTAGQTYGSVTTTSTGGGQPHNNMPPYITVYMWKRTA